MSSWHELKGQGSVGLLTAELEEERGGARRPRGGGWHSRSGAESGRSARPKSSQRRRWRRSWIFSGPSGGGSTLGPPFTGADSADAGPPSPSTVDPAHAEPARAEPATPDGADAGAMPAGDSPADVADAAPPEPASAAGAEGAGELVPWLERALNAELEASRSVPPTIISWSGPVAIAKHPFVAPQGGGIYIVMRAGRPMYVGETESFARRWHGRLLSAFQMGLTTPDGRLPRPLNVYFGRMMHGKNKDKQLRKAVEHVVIRTLINGKLVGPRELRNQTSILELSVKDQVHITRILPPTLLAALVKPGTVSGLTGDLLQLGKDARFELGGR